MSLDLDDLQLLLDVAELGSFSQAAAIRGWSQPLVSQRIATLEQTLGASLFQRHRRGVTPTPACEQFLPAARAALGALAEGRLAIQGAPALPRIRLACLPSLTSAVFSPLLRELVDGAFEIRCNTDHSGVIMQDLLTGECDIGFVLRCPPVAGLHMELLCRSPIIAVASPLHPLAGQQGLTLHHIANERIAPQQWGAGCDVFIQQMRRLREPTRSLHAIQPASAARELALEHGFITLMPALAVARDLELGRLIRLDVGDLPQDHWEVMMAWRSGKRPNAAKEVVLNAARGLAALWRGVE
ncbi:LysR family transcriptional regulator [Aeromonas diversa]|uniref:LysR family transcriptional regulator n=1 Tax=Aeromonas diversa CDC 2478-85 TaxID=1268237 RepID=N9VIX1_9GAMM|nr:LysR family transcriptional regulator [Aeromonas diversa]ENY71341.1 LysR family transcriptional regulator [Aeromonas diversa CDC 2478-85]